MLGAFAEVFRKFQYYAKKETSSDSIKVNFIQ